MIKYLTILSLLNFLFSQGWYNHPELNWETIETEHFLDDLSIIISETPEFIIFFLIYSSN